MGGRTRPHLSTPRRRPPSIRSSASDDADLYGTGDAGWRRVRPRAPLSRPSDQGVLMEGFDTFIVLAATYGSEDDAHKDYEAVKSLYYDDHIIDTFDAA